MTIPEAIDILTNNLDRVGVHIINANDTETQKYNSETIEALNMAIRSLNILNNMINDYNSGFNDGLISKNYPSSSQQGQWIKWEYGT